MSTTNPELAQTVSTPHRGWGLCAACTHSVRAANIDNEVR